MGDTQSYTFDQRYKICEENFEAMDGQYESNKVYNAWKHCIHRKGVCKPIERVYHTRNKAKADSPEEC